LFRLADKKNLVTHGVTRKIFHGTLGVHGKIFFITPGGLEKTKNSFVTLGGHGKFFWFHLAYKLKNFQVTLGGHKKNNFFLLRLAYCYAKRKKSRFGVLFVWELRRASHFGVTNLLRQKEKITFWRNQFLTGHVLLDFF